MFHRPRQLLLLCAAALALATVGHASSRWEDLSSGLNEFEVSAILGTPLIVHEARGYKQWTFDAGGLVMFHRGTVAYWGTPRGHKPSPKPQLLTVITEPIPGHETSVVADQAAHRSALAKAPTRPGFASPVAPSATTPVRNARVASFDEITKS